MKLASAALSLVAVMVAANAGAADSTYPNKPIRLIIPFVPYKGAGPAMTDLLANRIQGLVGSVTGTYPQVAAGKLRAIGTGHAKRLKNLPDIPTIGETLPGFINDGWYGLVAPAGTPKVIVDRLHEELSRALANAEFSKHIETIGMVPAGGTPSEFHEWIRSEVARWTKVVRDAGIGLK